jgi:hypothetical protein
MSSPIREPLPQSVERRVNEVLGNEEPITAALSDMDAEGQFGQTWLVGTRERLLVIAPNPDTPASLAESTVANRRRSDTEGQHRPEPRWQIPPLRRVDSSKALFAQNEHTRVDTEPLTVLQIPLRTITGVKARD